jgi:hypothetical protein
VKPLRLVKETVLVLTLGVASQATATEARFYGQTDGVLTVPNGEFHIVNPPPRHQPKWQACESGKPVVVSKDRKFFCCPEDAGDCGAIVPDGTAAK